MKNKNNVKPFFPGKTKEWAGVLFLFLLVAALTIAVFSGALKNDFIINWDDNINVTNNENIQDWSTSGIKQLFDPNRQIYEPRLTLFTFAWEYHNHKLDPAPYHLHNLLLHLVNLVLLFFFIKRIVGKNLPAIAAVLIFAIHPLHVEPVAWITGRKDLLFSFFYLASLLAYISYIKKPGNILWFFGALLFSLLGVLSKIQALSIPLAWIALDVYFKRPFSLRSLFEKFLVVIVMLYDYFSPGQILLLLIVYLILLLYEVLDRAEGFNRFAERVLKRLSRAWNVLLVLMIGAAVFAAVYKLNKVLGNGEQQRWLLSLVETGSIAAAYFIRLRSKLGWMEGWSWKNFRIRITIVALSVGIIILLLIVFFPALNFWTGTFRFDFSITDRLLMACYAVMYYLIHFIIPLSNSPIQPYPSDLGPLPVVYYLSGIALIGVLIFFVVMMIKRKIPNQPAVLFGLAFFLINIGMVLHLVSIEGRVIVADRYAYLAIAGLLISVVSFMDGWLKKRDRNIQKIPLYILLIVSIAFSWTSWSRIKIWKDGLTFFNKVIGYNPEYPLAYLNRGTLYVNRQQYDKAIADFDHAIRLDDKEEIAYYNRALAFFNLGQLDKAYLDCSRSIACSPDFFDGWYLRAFIKNKLGNYPGALADYNCAIRIRPDHELAYYNRGNTRKNLWDYKGALADYQQCIKLNPDFDKAYNAEGVALYFLQDYQASVRSFDMAIKKKPREGNYFFNRGLSKLKLNLTDEACRDFNTSWGFGYSDSQKLIKEHCN